MKWCQRDTPQHDDQSNQHDHDEANLDQPCGQRDCVSAYALRHWRSVARGACDDSAKEAELKS